MISLTRGNQLLQDARRSLQRDEESRLLKARQEEKDEGPSEVIERGEVLRKARWLAESNYCGNACLCHTRRAINCLPGTSLNWSDLKANCSSNCDFADPDGVCSTVASVFV